MPLGQNTHLQEHYENASHLSNRTTPSSEGESRTAGGTRKRVPVAVCYLSSGYNRPINDLYSVRDVENERSSAVAMREKTRVVSIARMQATLTIAASYE